MKTKPRNIIEGTIEQCEYGTFISYSIEIRNECVDLSMHIDQLNSLLIDEYLTFDNLDKDKLIRLIWISLSDNDRINPLHLLIQDIFYHRVLTKENKLYLSLTLRALDQIK